MSDEGTDIRATAALRLSDAIWTQLWCRWMQGPRLLIVYIVALTVGLSIPVLADGVPFSRLGPNLWAHLPLLFGLLGFLVALLILFPILIVSIRWPFLKKPRQMTLVLDDRGVRYLGTEIDYGSGWENVKVYSETTAALYIRAKRLLVRMPKRYIEEATFDKLRTEFSRRNIRRIPVWRFA